MGKTDFISRQAAIDIERNATVDTNPSHFEAHQKFTQFLDDAEISSFGRWQWSNGFNTALTAVGIDLKKLPSAQPERTGRWEQVEVNYFADMDEEIQESMAIASMFCPRCKRYHNEVYLYGDATYGVNFCPYCGADMRGEEYD